MTAHELAKKLLEGPDSEVLLYHSDSGCSGVVKQCHLVMEWEKDYPVMEIVG